MKNVKKIIFCLICCAAIGVQPALATEELCVGDECTPLSINLSGHTLGKGFGVANDGDGTFAAGQTLGEAAYKNLPGCLPMPTEGFARVSGRTTAIITGNNNTRESIVYTIDESGSQMNGFGEFTVSSTQANEGGTLINSGPATASGFYTGESKASATKVGEHSLNGRTWGESNSLSTVIITPGTATTPFKIEAYNNTTTLNASRISQ